eukprot:jgi/Ulvmu1/5314/UM022_0108.1
MIRSAVQAGLRAALAGAAHRELSHAIRAGSLTTYTWSTCSLLSARARQHGAAFASLPYSAADAALAPEKAYVEATVGTPTAAAAGDQTASGDANMRRDFVHFLRDAYGTPERAQSAMEAMGKYLRYAKTQLEQSGKTQLVLDQDIISNYVLCEDVVMRHHGAKEDKKELEAVATRLALLIQNLHHLMAYTTVRRFEQCTHSLFRRYVSVCSLLGDAQRVRSAWRALERTGHVQMLQDVNMNMVYIDTLLRAARTAPSAQYEEYLDTAVMELGRWQLRPPGERGVSVADGHADTAAPRNFTLFAHGGTVAHTYREAIFTIFGRRTRDLERLHQVISQFRGLRSHLRSGEPVPDSLLMGIGHAHNLLYMVARHSMDDSSTPVATIGDLLMFALEDISSALDAHAAMRRNGMRKPPVQYVDEGLVQLVLLQCDRIQNSRAALAALRLLERSLSKIPAPPAGEPGARPTTATGTRVPLATTYLSAIQACASDPGDAEQTQVLEALRLVATLERSYPPAAATPPRALDPVRQLAPLTERIGRSPAAWQHAWEQVELLDRDGALTLSHLNVMIAALAQLPDGAVLDDAAPAEAAPAEAAPAEAAPAEAAPEESEGGGTQAPEAAQVDSLARKAVEVHQLAGKAFEAVNVHTFNALLSVFCRQDGAKNSSQLILNLLELMAEQGVARSQETYDLLLRHWAARRIFKAVLATVEDMTAAGITPDPQHIRTAIYDADSLGMDDEAHALRLILEDMNIRSVAPQQRRPQRNFDSRGRAVQER